MAGLRSSPRAEHLPRPHTPYDFPVQGIEAVGWTAGKKKDVDGPTLDVGLFSLLKTHTSEIVMTKENLIHSAVLGAASLNVNDVHLHQWQPRRSTTRGITGSDSVAGRSAHLQAFAMAKPFVARVCAAEAKKLEVTVKQMEQGKSHG